MDNGRSEWPRGLTRRSAAARLLEMPEGMDVCVLRVLCVVRSLCEGLITRPEKFYRVWGVVVWDIETSKMRRPWSALGRSATGRITRTEH